MSVAEMRLSLIGFLLIAAIAVWLELLGRNSLRWPRVPVAPLGRTFRAAQVSAVGRWTVLLVWWWFGWHFLAR